MHARRWLIRVLAGGACASASWFVFSGTGCGGDEVAVTPAVEPDAGGSSDDEDNLGDGLDDDGGLPPPVPTDGGAVIPSKIRYVLVLVKENHTFDNYFTDFPGATSSKTAKLSNGTTITRPVAPTGPLVKDICHANSCGQKAYRDGGMNGFDLNNPTLPFVKYTEQQIPNYWQYARNFVLADHLFSTTLGP
ncbi:MAG: phosphoesterase, partial [Myxococcaceae bacterium]|nr:phosphoesterase [Myxococcaceae bacterium]